MAYDSGNFGKTLIFGSADRTIFHLMTDAPGEQAVNLMLRVMPD